MLKLNSKIEKYMDNAVFSSFLITNLINDLLDSAKLEKEVFELNLNYFNMLEVIT